MIATTEHATVTLKCHFCEERLPRTGFRLLAGRRISICPKCWPSLETYFLMLGDVQEQIIEQTFRAALSLIKICRQSGSAPPTPGMLVETIDELTSPAQSR